MIQTINDPFKIPQNIKESLQVEKLNNESKLFNKVGSCLYNLRTISFKNPKDSLDIQENTRCNFERFEAGYLLRFNDYQKYYVLPLKFSQNWKLQMIKGKEDINPRSIAALLLLLGVSKEYLLNHWLFSNGFYYTRFKLYSTPHLQDHYVMLLRHFFSFFLFRYFAY